MYLDILNLLIGFLLLLFLPGFSLTLALYPKREIGIFERISLSIVSSISLNVLSIFFLNYFLKQPITLPSLIIDILSVTLFFTAIYLFRARELPWAGLRKLSDKKILSEKQNKKNSTRIFVPNLPKANSGFVLQDEQNPFRILSQKNEQNPSEGFCLRKKFFSKIFSEIQRIFSDKVHTLSYSRKKFLEVSCILSLLLITFLLVYGIHKDYSYPFISDEWHHIAQGVQIVDKEGIHLQNPYYKEDVEFLETGFFEIGFHVFLAEFFLLTSQDLVLSYVYLPAVFACISSFILFTFVYKVSKNFYIGLLSMLFFAGLKSNISVLGPWFFIPLTLGFAYIYLLFYLTITGLERNSFVSLALSAFILLSLALIHPWSASFIMPVVVVYLLLRPGLISKNLWGLLVFFLIPLSSFIYVFRILWQGSFIETLDYFIKNFLIRDLGIPANTGVGHYLYPLDFYGFIPLLLAFIAIYVIVRNGGQKKVFLVWISLMSFLILIFQLRGLTLLAPYERVFYYTLLSLVPLSAIGLFGVLNLINSKIKTRYVSITLLTFCILLVVYSLFSGYYESDKLYRLIDDPTYSALKWLEGDRRYYNVVLSRPTISSAVYPVTKNYVVSINPAQLGHSARGLEDNKEFFMSPGCDAKKKILEKYDVDYVLVEEDDKIRCDFMREIYNKGGVYIYRVENGDL
ncbi:MAG: DUF1616 domain-containing protein [Candidatus Altiarchaeota archaeon]|nr:DUF1616 domain-containing protein [Candidatus Altiarchaeota archaeon]